MPRHSNYGRKIQNAEAMGIEDSVVSSGGGGAVASDGEAMKVEIVGRVDTTTGADGPLKPTLEIANYGVTSLNPASRNQDPNAAKTYYTHSRDDNYDLRYAATVSSFSSFSSGTGTGQGGMQYQTASDIDFSEDVKTASHVATSGRTLEPANTWMQGSNKYNDYPHDKWSDYQATSQESAPKDLNHYGRIRYISQSGVVSPWSDPVKINMEPEIIHRHYLGTHTLNKFESCLMTLVMTPTADHSPFGQDPLAYFDAVGSPEYKTNNERYYWNLHVPPEFRQTTDADQMRKTLQANDPRNLFSVCFDRHHCYDFGNQKVKTKAIRDIDYAKVKTVLKKLIEDNIGVGNFDETAKYKTHIKYWQSPYGYRTENSSYFSTFSRYIPFQETNNFPKNGYTYKYSSNYPSNYMESTYADSPGAFGALFTNGRNSTGDMRFPLFGTTYKGKDYFFLFEDYDGMGFPYTGELNYSENYAPKSSDHNSSYHPKKNTLIWIMFQMLYDEIDSYDPDNAAGLSLYETFLVKFLNQNFWMETIVRSTHSSYNSYNQARDSNVLKYSNFKRSSFPSLDGFSFWDELRGFYGFNALGEKEDPHYMFLDSRSNFPIKAGEYKVVAIGDGTGAHDNNYQNGGMSGGFVTAHISVPEDTTANIIFDPDSGNSIEINGTVYKANIAQHNPMGGQTTFNGLHRGQGMTMYHTSNPTMYLKNISANLSEQWLLTDQRNKGYLSTGFGKALDGMGTNPSAASAAKESAPGTGALIPGCGMSADLVQSSSSNDTTWNYSNSRSNMDASYYAITNYMWSLPYSKGAVFLMNKNEGVRGSHP